MTFTRKKSNQVKWHLEIYIFWNSCSGLRYHWLVIPAPAVGALITRPASALPPLLPPPTPADMSSETPAKRKGQTDHNPPLSNPKKKSVRHRASLACEECRTRKRRCDGATPACGGCVKRMSACVYASEIHAKTWRET